MINKNVTNILLALTFFTATTPMAQSATLYSEQLVKGKKLDCTVIKPWDESAGPANQQYPVIVWANGWGSQNTDLTRGYKPGLIEWALDGPYIVVAANSRSPKESDVLQCAQWIKAQNNIGGSEYQGVINTNKIGLAGHSQAAGVMIRASQVKSDYEYSTVVAMTPYAANWNYADSQNGPVMIIGGSADSVAPVADYAQYAWNAVIQSGQGGVMTIVVLSS